MNTITNTAPPIKHTPQPVKLTFSSYQKFVVGILAFLQFTIILDFMIISPLGAIVMPALHIGTHEFGVAVSSYAFSAAISGIAAAGFADRFDRKRLLLFFYAGFILGTALCALAPTYHFLLVARVVTGLFGGVIGSVVLAIAADLFPLEMRGRVMGIVQTAFAGAQVLGLPVGIYLANLWNWHLPFVAIIAIAVPASLVIMVYMKPVVGHLKLKQEHSAWRHLARTLFEPKYAPAFVGIMALTTGGYIIMPFLSTFIVNNLGIPLRNLPTIYLVTGLCTVVTGPLIGKASDRFGKFRTFVFGTVVFLIMIAVYTNLGPASLTTVTVVNALAFCRRLFAHDPGAGSVFRCTRAHQARIVQRHHGLVAAIFRRDRLCIRRADPCPKQRGSAAALRLDGLHRHGHGAAGPRTDLSHSSGGARTINSNPFHLKGNKL